MAHGRKTLRHGVVRVLKGERPAQEPSYPIPHVGANVFPNRSTPLWELENYSLLVYIENEDADNDRDASRRKYDRKARLVVEAVCIADEKCDDRLDEIAEVVEKLLLQDGQELIDPVTGDKITTDIALQSSQCYFIGDEVGNIAASLRVEFMVEWDYEVPYRDAEIGEDFETMKADIHVKGSDAKISILTTGLDD